MGDHGDQIGRLESLFAYDATEATKLSDYLTRIIVDTKRTTTFPAVPLDPEEVTALFGGTTLRDEGETLASYLLHLVDAILPNVLNLSSPRNMAHMSSLVPPFRAELSRLVAALNANMLKTDASGSLNHCERQALGILHRAVFDRSDDFYINHTHNIESTLGIATSGGSTANLIGLWLARNRYLHRTPDADLSHAAIVVSELSHYSITKAADLLGLPSDSVVSIPTDGNLTVDVGKLEEMVGQLERDGRRVLAVIGNSGTTDAGSFDDLDALASISQRSGCHFHGDACWGGPVFFSAAHRYLVAGIHRADTVALDAHKKFHLPIGLGITLCADPTLANAIEHTATYLNRRGSRDLGRRSLEGSRPAATLLLHACLHVFGRRGLEAMVDARMRLARELAEMIEESDDFELLAPATGDIVLYRYRFDDDDGLSSRLNEALCREQRLRGRHQITMTKSPPKDGDGPVALRAVITNPFSTTSDASALIEEQRDQAKSIVARYANRRSRQRVHPPGLRGDISADGLRISGASIDDLSPGGAFIRTSGELSTGETISVVLRRSDGQEINLKGRIAYRIANQSEAEPGRSPGIGLQFLEIDTDQRELLEQILAATTDESRAARSSVGLAEAFEESAARHANQTFVYAPDGDHTFAEVRSLYDEFVAGLERLNAGGRVILAVHDRSPEALAFVLAVRKVGAAYVPVDPCAPVARVRALNDQINPAMVVSDRDIDLSDLGAYTFAALRSPEQLTPLSTQAPEARGAEEVPAAIMFTSGSTGSPNPVSWSEERLWQRIRSEPLIVKPDDCWCWFASCGFVDSILEVFYPATQGIAVAIAPANIAANPPELVKLAARARITRLVCPASYLSLILSRGDCLSGRPRSLRAWVSTGEVLDWSVVRRFRELLPSAALYNEYGTTELGDIAFGEVPESTEASGPVPAGTPLEGFAVRIADADGSDCPPGVPGAVQVRTVPSTVTGARGMGDWLATGDQGRIHVDGTLTVLGRADGVIKRGGVRMDPSEIEGVLCMHPMVMDAAVRQWRLDKGGEGALVGYVKTAAGKMPPVEELRALCEKHLPEPMRPLLFEPVGEVPRTQSGKKLRRSLPPPRLDDDGL